MSTGTRTEEKEKGVPEPPESFAQMFHRLGAREIEAAAAYQFKACRLCGDVRMVPNGTLIVSRLKYCDHKGDWHESAEAGDGRLEVVPVMVLERPVEGGRSGG